MEQDLKQLQKTEALNRLRILQMKYELLENVITEFEKEDTVYYSEYQNKAFPAVLYWVTNEEKYVKIIKEVEEQKNILVYHVILTPTVNGTYLSLLYVSKYQEEWQTDRNDLTEGYPIAYGINLADPQMAEFGGIQISGAMGGIRQLS